MSIKSLRLTSATSALLCATPFLFSGALAQNEDSSTEDEIFVTGSPINTSVDESLVGVSVLDGDELANRLNGTIGETLKSEPGVTSTFFGPGASRPIIRGQGGSRVRVLDNGIGTVDASSISPDHAVAAEPALAERVEVVRGSGILRYGSGATGGVVNIIDGRIPREVPEDGIDGVLRATASTVDDGSELAGAANFLLGKAGTADIVLHIEGTYRDTDDYDIPGFAESAFQRAAEEGEGEEEEEEEARDVLENSFTKTDTLAAGLSFVSDRGFIGLAVKQANSEYGVPGGGHHHHEEGEEEGGDEEEEEEENVFIELEQTRYDLNGELALDGATFEKINIFAGYADYEHIEFEGPGEVGTVFTNEGFETRLELIQRPRGEWKGAVGLQYNDNEFSAIGEEAFVPPTTSEQIGLFTFQETNVGDWHFEGAARFENTSHTDDTNNVEREFDTFSVSGGADYHFNENWRVGGIIFRTERAPATEELFSNGPHLATNQFEIGDNTLDTETATGIEAAIRFRNEVASLSFNVFHTTYDDFIFLGATGGEEDELPIYEFQAADTVFRGFEIAGDVILSDDGKTVWTADAVLEKVEAEKDVVNNDNLPQIPPLGLLLGLQAESDYLIVRGEVDYAAEQNSVAPFELPTDSYTALNAFISITPIKSDPTLKVRIAGLNLTDEEIRQHSSPLKAVVPQPGRNFRISLEKSF